MSDGPMKPARPAPPGMPTLGPDAAQDLTRAILARTSGSPCARVREQACEFVDGELDQARSGLVSDHLEHCAGCLGVIQALRQAKTVLPLMAEPNPGPWLTARVMRATVHAPRRRPIDWRGAWEKLIHRPRIALEAAYLGTAVSLMGFALPRPASLPAPHAIVRSLSPTPVIESLKPPAHRALGVLVAVERHTAEGIQQGLKLAPSGEAGAASSNLTPWQRSSLHFRSWFHAVSGAPQEKRTSPANP